MGLAKKLGVVGSRGSTLLEDDPVPYQWSKQTYTMQHILQKFKFPCVVQCATDSCTVEWSDFQFDLQQPLLLHSARHIRKLHARSLRANQDGDGPLEEFGPPLAIPEDYEGWFAATPKGVNKVKRHLRIEGVAKSTSRRFLVTTKCPAFTFSRTSDGRMDHVPHDVTPGEILNRVCVLEEDSSDVDTPEVVKEHGPCLECLDDKEEPVIIPLSHRAIIYELADDYPDDSQRVFRACSVVKAGNSKLPRILTLVHGEPPVLAFTFTGLIRCYTVFSEETILAGTLDDPSSICLELATDSSARFRLALNETSIKKTCEYSNATQICHTFGSKFLMGIKVSFSLKPELTDLDDIDMSLYEQASASDTQEVNANSEFEIAWGSVKKAKLLTAAASDCVDNNVGEGSDLESVAPALDSLKNFGKRASSSEGSKVSLSREISDSSDLSSIPQHRDFTEQEIADLIWRKGLRESAGHDSEEPADLSEIESIKENRVTDNPMYYFFLRNQNQSKGSSKSESVHLEESEKVNADNGKTKENIENPLGYLFQNKLESDVIDSGERRTNELIDIQRQEQPYTTACTDVYIPDQTPIVYTKAKVYCENMNDSETDSDCSSISAQEQNAELTTSFRAGDDTVTSSDKHAPLAMTLDSVDCDTMPGLVAHVDMTMSTSSRPTLGDSNLLDEDDESVDELLSLVKQQNLMLSMPTPDLSDTASHESCSINYECLDDVTSSPLHEDYLASISSSSVSDVGSPSSHPAIEPAHQSETDDAAIERLNSLIDEVSVLVSSSSGRILERRRLSSNLALEDISSSASSMTQTDELNLVSGSALMVDSHDSGHSPSEKADNASGLLMSPTDQENHGPLPPFVQAGDEHCPDRQDEKNEVCRNEQMNDLLDQFPDNSDDLLDQCDKKSDDYNHEREVETKVGAASVIHKSKISDKRDVLRRSDRSYRGRKKQNRESAMNFSVGMTDRNKSRSDDIPGALKRSRVQLNLADIESPDSQSWPISKDCIHKFKSESQLSGDPMGLPVNEGGNRFYSSKVKYHPHTHPHERVERLSDGARTEGKQNTSDEATPGATRDGNSAPSSLTRRQRSSNIVSAVQKFERLSSSCPGEASKANERSFHDAPHVNSGVNGGCAESDTKEVIAIQEHFGLGDREAVCPGLQEKQVFFTEGDYPSENYMYV